MRIETIRVRTRQSSQLIDITREVESAVRAAGIAGGLCLVFCPHTTAGITINENADPAVRRDILMELDHIVPLEDGYLHAEGNSAAHVKASLVGHSATVLIQNGRLVLGTWQGIYLCEFDGPRTRNVLIGLMEG